ncbi:uncharacterized protein LOC143034318 [Oratosquilla oratoria]|uniref:uncharacterized protein LOC143034318 n=1 Tax=Oratosquilla oratoria TaxID=337810 RepID=UPI003F776E5B
MGIANANYEFIMCDFGTNGRISDGGVLDNTKFYDKLVGGLLCVPVAEKVHNSEKVLPYVFLGDEAFAMRKDFLKPFSQKDLTDERRVFNYRLSRARRVIENVFGILAARFRIFHTKINLGLQNINSLVMACCILYNFLRITSSGHYTQSECFDVEDTESGTDSSNLVSLNIGHNRHPAQDAKQVREMYLQYFNNEGKLSW